MRLTEISYGQAQPVDGYGPGFFRLGGHVLRGACLITPWDAGGWGGLEGTATPLSLVGKVEVMSSPAACRTYNVLLGEGRLIAAALLPVHEVPR